MTTQHHLIQVTVGCFGTYTCIGPTICDNFVETGKLWNNHLVHTHGMLLVR